MAVIAARHVGAGLAERKVRVDADKAVSLNAVDVRSRDFERRGISALV
jgi:hypothetical protein